MAALFQIKKVKSIAVKCESYSKGFNFLPNDWNFASYFGAIFFQSYFEVTLFKLKFRNVWKFVNAQIIFFNKSL